MWSHFSTQLKLSKAMKILSLILLISFFITSCRQAEKAPAVRDHDLHFNRLATSWDEAIPLGNGMLGLLVWKKGENLRFSLDRADLWDLRPMSNLSRPEWKYSWVFEQWKKNNYGVVQEAFDRPYDDLPAPSKIPAGALEFNISKLGDTESVALNLAGAECEIRWKNGTTLKTFVHASENAGWYRFENLPDSIRPKLVSPAYTSHGDNKASEMSFFDLDRLGYSAGEESETDSTITFSQEGWGGFRYRIFVKWENRGSTQTGCWSISSSFPGWKDMPAADKNVTDAIGKGFNASVKEHSAWWKNFWASSSVSIPDTILEKQWYLEMYKFGASARADAPPVSLQAVWTADNGKLPPWKGDFHNDLNTQLSYWPAYSSNHLDLEQGYINWLFNNRDTFKRYTKAYFGKEGMNVPGVATLTGEPMGGWIQYSFGPTVAAWLSHHFYLHWRYTMDRNFLKEKAYPWINDVAIFLDENSIRGNDGKRKLPISSSPEIFDNSAKAWFPEISNFDLSLIKWTFEKAAELAGELSLKDDSIKWGTVLSEWPDFTIDPGTGFMFAPGIPYNQSHRHFSHLMAFHPLGLIDYSKGESDKQIIDNTLKNLTATGSDWWCGYSFSWLGNLYARALNGEKAAEALKTFATCFCLPNSFHVNGDQTKSGKSKFTYRPFTLEGNFAFAAGIQEMLLQSHAGFVRIFPAIPGSWKDLSFNDLRTEGAFLVSALMKNGAVVSVRIHSEKGGIMRLKNPFSESGFKCSKDIKTKADLIEISFVPGENVTLGGR
jgi:alpha-L-fucosidase 2